MQIQKYKNAIILTNSNMNGGVYCDNHFVFNSSLHRNWVKSYPSNVCANKIRHEKVIYIGMFHDVWGHCITDCLKHLWFMIDSKYDELKNLKFVYLCVYPNFKLFDNFKNILIKLGIDVSNIELITESTQFDEVYIPDECFYFDENNNEYFFTNEYKKIIDKISADIIPDTTYNKIYFSRSKIKTHKEIGEKYIEDTMKKAGYQIISPELLNFEQQISLLKGCKFFATTEGSISHNIIFCSENCNVLILLKNSGIINPYQKCLNTLKKFNVINIDVSKSFLNNKNQPWTGPFFIYANHELTNFLGTEVQSFPIFDFIFRYICGNIPTVIKRFIKKILGR